MRCKDILIATTSGSNKSMSLFVVNHRMTDGHCFLNFYPHKVDHKWNR
jgi:hypothetical protein